MPTEIPYTIYSLTSREHRWEIFGRYYEYALLQQETKLNAWAHYEYIPNDTYSFYKVKKTLKQMHGYVIKPSRYWNDTCALSVQDHVLYSLAEYCPGLPRDANIVADNHYLGIHPYRMLESFSKYDDVGKRTDPDIEATIKALVTYGTIPNREQRALVDLMEKVQVVTNKYFHWTKNWPFLAAHRLLTMQLNRCNHIKRVLTELLPNHPLNNAYSASFTSSVNPGNPLHQQDPRLKVEGLWIAFPIGVSPRSWRPRRQGLLKPIPLLQGSATAVAFANPLASQGSF